MNISYPIQGLAIVGPILFLVMAILTPVIGVFAGWKRAAYWGGGNFVVYFGGLAAWRLAGDKISALLQPLIKQALESIKIDPTKVADLVKSLVAPVFLLVLFLVMNLILFICYYAFAKRCMRIGKFSPEKRLIRLENKIKKAKINHKDPEVIAKLTAKKNKWEVRVQKVVNSVGHKVWFNRTIGGISFTVAMLPVVLTIPQVITMATTSKETRANNKFASKIYDFLYKANDKLSWMYYYDTKTATDFDAGFGLLESFTKTLDEVEIIVYDSATDTYKTEKASSQKLMDVLPNTLSLGMNAVLKANNKGTTAEEKKTYIKSSISTLATSWNSIMDKASNQISSLFQSENVTALLEPVINEMLPKDQKLTIDDNEFNKMFGTDSQFNEILTEYEDALEHPEAHQDLTTLTAIPTTKKCIDNLTTSFYGMVNTQSLSDTNKQKLDEKINKMLGMFVYVA